MRTLLAAAILAAGAFGWAKPVPKPTKPTERAGGVISQVHDRVDEAVVSQMIRDLHLHIWQAEAGGQMPTPEAIREYGRKEKRKLGQLLEKGEIVLAANLTRSGVWAYQKDTPEKGGWVAVQAGPRKVTAQEFKELVGK